MSRPIRYREFTESQIKDGELIVLDKKGKIYAEFKVKGGHASLIITYWCDIKKNIYYQKYTYRNDTLLSLYEFYYNGKKMGETIFTGTGYLDVMYYKNGNKLWVAEENFDRVWDGTLRTYYESGNIAEVSTWNNGKEYGVDNVYYESGNLKYERNFSDGKKNGPWKEYYENGQLHIEKGYKDDLQIGETKEYDKKGNLIPADKKNK